MNPKSINEMVKKVLDSLPQGVKNIPDDIKKSVHTVVSSTLDKLDVVTREEFDAQKKVLERTREKLEKIEQELAALSKSKQD